MSFITKCFWQLILIPLRIMAYFFKVTIHGTSPIRPAVAGEVPASQAGFCGYSNVRTSASVVNPHRSLP